MLDEHLILNTRMEPLVYNIVEYWSRIILFRAVFPVHADACTLRTNYTPTHLPNDDETLGAFHSQNSVEFKDE